MSYDQQKKLLLHPKKNKNLDEKRIARTVKTKQKNALPAYFVFFLKAKACKCKSSGIHTEPTVTHRALISHCSEKVTS